MQRIGKGGGIIRAWHTWLGGIFTANPQGRIAGNISRREGDLGDKEALAATLPIYLHTLPYQPQINTSFLMANHLVVFTFSCGSELGSGSFSTDRGSWSWVLGFFRGMDAEFLDPRPGISGVLVLLVLTECYAVASLVGKGVFLGGQV